MICCGKYTELDVCPYCGKSISPEELDQETIWNTGFDCYD